MLNKRETPNVQDYIATLKSNKWHARKISGPKFLTRWDSYNMVAACKYFII